MRMNKRMVLPLALGVGVLGLLASSQLASATHVRPKGATPLYASLVPAYKACTSPNRTHAAPLSFQSCNPPVQSSNFLTVGTPDANGAAANSIGFVRLVVKTTSPEDILITSSLSDVRCKAGTAAAVCTQTNVASGPDYSGALKGTAQVRISDHYNGPGLNEAATVQDIDFPFTASCANTAADTSIGANCSVSTSANAVNPGSVQTTQREVLEFGPISLNDGGANGIAGAPDATQFMTQGIFIP
jgi:hypothetical protein